MALNNLTKVQTLGIGSNIEVVGVITTGQFKSGTSNLHASGVELTNLNVSGIATIGGNVSIGGTLTYQDVTNIDSVGIITARSNIDCNGDLDVDGHTELDNINIAGVATFSQGGSEVVRINSGGLLLYNDLSFFGASTHAYWDHSANQFKLNDNTKLSVGSGSDLQLYHDGSHSRIYNSTGTLSVRSAIFDVLNADGSERMFKATADAGCDLFFNGDLKLQTRSTDTVFYDDIRLGDNHKVNVGTLDDMQLYHDGTFSYIAAPNNHQIHINASSGGTTENMAKFKPNGAAELYHNGTKKFETSATGITVTGEVAASGNVSCVNLNPTGNLKLLDSTAPDYIGNLYIGNSNDFKLFHNGSENFIRSGPGNANIRIDNNSGVLGAKFVPAGAAELYHNGERKLFTKDNGVQIEDTTATGAYLTMTTSSGTAGKLYATGNNTLGFLDSQNHYMLKGVKDGALELYHDNVKVVKTNSYGMQVGAKATSDSNSHVAVDGWVLADSWTKAVFDGGTGGNSPLTIYNKNAGFNRYMCYFKFDGGFANYSSNDINLCDERVKKDFAEVPSQWNNIKNIGFKHFRYKEDSNSEPLKIGVVAQQIETVYPDLINESWPQGDANPNTGEGTFYKGVKEEQLLMYSVKALQEAQARIETLEAKVAALEGA